MAEANVIEVVIKSVDQMSADLSKLQTEMGKLRGATTQLGTASSTASSGLEQLNTAATALGVAFQPLRNHASILIRSWELLKANAPIAAIGALATGAFTLAKNFSDLGVEMGRVARQTGFTTEALSGLKTVAEGVDVSFGEVTSSIRFFNRLLGQAAQGSREARDVFERLAISEAEVADGLKDPQALYELVAKRFVNIGSAAEQTALQFRLFGRGGRDVTLVLEELAKKGLKGAEQEAEALGLLWTKDMVAAARRFNDAINSISQTLKGFTIIIGATVLPAVELFLAALSRIANIRIPQVVAPKTIEQLQKELAVATEKLARFNDEMPTVAEARKSFKAVTDEVIRLRAAIDELDKVGPKIEIEIAPKLSPEQARTLDKFRLELSRNVEDLQNKIKTLDIQEPLLARIIGLNQFDRTLDDFVRQFNESLPDNLKKLRISRATFAPFRQALGDALLVLEKEELAKIKRDIEGNSLKIITEAVFKAQQQGILVSELEADREPTPAQIEARERFEIAARMQERIATRTSILDDARTDNLQRQLASLQLAEAPLNQILVVTRQLDELEKERLLTEIRRKEAQRDVLKALLDAGAATLAQREEYHKLATEVEVLTTKIGTVGTRTIETLVNARQQAESMANTLASEFTDRFIALMEGKAGTLQEFFAGLGRTVVSQFLQAMIAKLIEGNIAQLLANAGGQATRDFQRFGVGGVAAGGILGLLGLGPPDTRTTKEVAAADLAKLTEKIGQAAVDALDAAGAVADEVVGAVAQIEVAAAAASLVVAGTGLTTASAALDFSAVGLTTAAAELSSAAFALAAAAGGSGGGASGGGFLGALGGLFGGGGGGGNVPDPTHLFPDVSLFGRGGLVVPKGFIRPFQHGGVVTGPTLGVIGEEGPEIVARMKPARSRADANEEPKVNVVINGDITPRRPDMSPKEVIQIVVNDGMRGGKISNMTSTIMRRNR